MNWNVIIGGVFGLMAASLGALLAYALGERRAEKERVRAANDRREQELALGRLEGGALLAQTAMLLEDCKPTSRYLWPDEDERRRELRSRCEALRTGLYRFVSSPLFLDLSDTVNVLAQVCYDMVNFSTRVRTGYGQPTYDLDEARFDEILKPWRYLRDRLSLEELLREPAWRFSPEIEAVNEKWYQQQMARIDAELRVGVEKINAQRAEKHNAH